MLPWTPKELADQTHVSISELNNCHQLHTLPHSLLLCLHSPAITSSSSFGSSVFCPAFVTFVVLRHLFDFPYILAAFVVACSVSSLLLRFFQAPLRVSPCSDLPDYSPNMTGSPRVLRDACSPLYPALMAEKQMQADAEKAKGGKSEKGEYKPLDLNADFVVHMDANDKPGKCAWKVVVVPLVLFLLIIKAVEDGWFSAVLAYLSGK